MTVSPSAAPCSSARFAQASIIAGAVSRRSGSRTSAYSPSTCRRIDSSWLAQVAMVMSMSASTDPIWPKTRWTMETWLPSASRRTLRNCLERVLLESGHRRVPEPPESRTRWIISGSLPVSTWRPRPTRRAWTRTRSGRRPSRTRRPSPWARCRWVETGLGSRQRA